MYNKKQKPMKKCNNFNDPSTKFCGITPKNSPVSCESNSAIHQSSKSADSSPSQVAQNNYSEIGNQKSESENEWDNWDAFADI